MVPYGRRCSIALRWVHMKSSYKHFYLQLLSIHYILRVCHIFVCCSFRRKWNVGLSWTVTVRWSWQWQHYYTSSSSSCCCYCCCCCRRRCSSSSSCCCCCCCVVFVVFRGRWNASLSLTVTVQSAGHSSGNIIILVVVVVVVVIVVVVVVWCL